ncbi:FKBP-type peptidyl-prolyl cis-trans isomerase [Hymenobacter sp. ASUV-10]|uniref:Peptidyl-prolyl cis-trans isomerase n=1 Tax=Hymenobacter aranciens TaxID=3063996 RepID=A0ABT9BFG6_9BACT|nr:FKBP-type peptidyl-prolyl cis-trans isomerase [Hymenobacter sp. ASUV-10]MDO7877011.1 FKBP-type peptidyl-prolyl cis-trans isomerase [Hymenobacter sp. ASUV-10]
MMKRTLFSFPALKALFFLVLAVPAFWSCNTETAYMKSIREQTEAYKIIDNDTIQNYIRRNGYVNSAQTTATGLSIVTLTAGPATGTAVTAGKQVRVKYVGRFLNNSYNNTLFPPGGIFENSSENHSTCGCAVFTGGVASPFGAGFSEGLLTMREGDRKLLLIPSRLAFSTAGQVNATNTGYTIPPNAVLSFDIEVLDVL